MLRGVRHRVKFPKAAAAKLQVLGLGAQHPCPPRWRLQEAAGPAATAAAVTGQRALEHGTHRLRDLA